MAIVKLLFDVKRQFFDDNGVPLAGGKLHTYQTGTNTEKTTYSDAEGVTPHTNPVVLDSAGRATVFGNGAYKVILKDADNVTVWTEPNVTSSAPSYDVDTVADLKALIPGSVSLVRTLGRLAKNDGGGWEYYWDASSSAADDGGMVLQPLSLPATGRYIGVKPADRIVNLRVYGPAIDGVTDDVSVLQKCDAYCVANGCTMFIDGDVYLATDPGIVSPGITSPVKLTRGAVLSWGNFSLEMKADIDINDTTQHFTCSASYVPTLASAFMRPEWFGETYDSHAKMTACLAQSLTTKKVMFTGVISTNNAEMN